MFQLYDRTRRRISLALFVLLAIVPTIGVIGYAIWLRTAAHVRSVERGLGQQLGLKVSLENIRYLSPSKTIYENVRLTDAESGCTIFSCKRMEAVCRSRTDAQGKPQPSLVLTADEAELDAAQSRQAWASLDRFLTRQTGWGDVDVQLLAPQVSWRVADASQTLQDVQLRFYSGAAESWADFNFRLAQSDMPNPVRFCVGRSRRSQPPVILLDTMGSIVPCSLLPDWLDLPHLLGPQCLVRGCLQAIPTNPGWMGEAKGQFWSVDLDRLVTDRFPPHALRGLANVTVDRAQFAQGRLVQLQGTVQAGNGSISGSLLDAAAGWLGLEKSTEQIPPQSLIRYDALTLALRVDEQGLQIRGQDTSGTILSGPQGALLRQTAMSQRPIPVQSLFETLALVQHLPARQEPQIATRPSAPRR